jgi:hypothetical protein
MSSEMRCMHVWRKRKQRKRSTSPVTACTLRLHLAPDHPWPQMLAHSSGSLSRTTAIQAIQIDQLFRLFAVEFVHLPPGFKSSIWHWCSYFSGFISGFNGAMLGRRRWVCGDFVNLEICRLSPSDVLIGVGFACVCSYERVRVRVVSVYVVLCNSKKRQ